jgi:long-chain acyl-CoA synthetase
MLCSFDRRAARSRDRLLIGSTTWRATTGDVDDWSRQVAAAIADAGVPPGSLVGLTAPTGPAFLAGLLGLRRASCVVLPLDDAAPTGDRARVLDSLAASARLTCRVDPGTRALTTTVVRQAAPIGPAFDADIAVVKATSGSTGAPRGVAVTAHALLADEDALASTMGIAASDRLVAAIPMSHSYGLTTLAVAALVRGVTLVVPADSGPLAPLLAARVADATVFPTVPAYVQALQRMADPPAWPESIRLSLTAGAPLPPPVAARFREMTGRGLHVFYGSSECGGICFDRGGEAGERGTVGTPVDGVRVTIASGTDANDAQAGLVTVQSAAVGRRYWPEADPRLEHGVFRTTDVARWRSGELELMGRADRVINVRGFKVDPIEVERVLAAMPGVDEVAVVGVAGPDGSGMMVRAVVACQPGRVEASAVTAWCRGRLADFKVPRSVIVVGALPRTARGKLDHAAVSVMTGVAGRSASGHV